MRVPGTRGRGRKTIRQALGSIWTFVLRYQCSVVARFIIWVLRGMGTPMGVLVGILVVLVAGQPGQ